MEEWWKKCDAHPPKEKPKERAVAYYRHSAQDRQQNSIPLQREQVRKWAGENGIEIIREFADPGKSGLTAEGRPAFIDMLENWVKKRDDFQHVLVLDVSRWGRFQDIDLSATYSAECKKHGKVVVYTTLGLPKENDPLHSILIGFERFRAAQYSRDLSDKALKGLIRIAQQGYCTGNNGSYGLQRILLDEARRPVQVLKYGEWKSIHNQRVTLGPGDPKDVAVIQRIFSEFVHDRRDETDIADDLNRDGIPTPRGAKWNRSSIRRMLRKEVYCGTLVYNRTTTRLRSNRRQNPREKWVITPSAFQGIVTKEDFDKAQAILREQKLRLAPEKLLEKMKKVYSERGLVSKESIEKALKAEGSSNALYYTHFAGLRAAFQEMFRAVREEAIRIVRGELENLATDVREHEDFLVLNRRLTVLIQPSVPVPMGYRSTWPFWPDPRPIIDITLGVPLSGAGEFRILGYLAFPRLILRKQTNIFRSRDARVEVFGHQGLDFIKELLR